MNTWDYKLADLRNQFGIVLQDSVLFSTSNVENIVYGLSGRAAKTNCKGCWR